MSMKKTTLDSRRRFIKITVVGASIALIAGVAGVAQAGDLSHVGSSDPTAQALGYVEDATASKNPLYKAGSNCANCQLYSGPPSGYGPCQLFPGKAVNSKGWCSGYTPK